MKLNVASSVLFLAMAVTLIRSSAYAEEPKTEAAVTDPVQIRQEQIPDAVDHGKTAEQALPGVSDDNEQVQQEMDKLYQGAVEREKLAQEQIKRLAAEKAELERLCPPKQGESDQKTQTDISAKKKIPAKTSAGKRKHSRHATASKGKKIKSAVKKTRSKKLRTKKAAAAPLKKCSGPKSTLAEVKKILAGNRNLSGKNLGKLNLTGMNLSRANFKGACFIGASLERADLAETDLERADLSDANLRKASLRLANINAASLDGATLDGAIWTDSRICLEGSVGSCRDVIP